jgi:nicotinate-nucleotide adenylyltransferase
MEYLCFGGSFNPIHIGHLECSINAARQVGCGGVFLIPNYLPPLKKATAYFADAKDRMEMCVLAAEMARGHEAIRVEVDDIELRLPTPSYTINTVLALKRERGWKRVKWMIGADELMSLPKWKSPRELLAETEFVVVNRPGHEIEWDKLPLEFHVLKNNVVEAPRMDISSTEIRRRIAAGEPWRQMVPPRVAEFINAKGLYRG